MIKSKSLKTVFLLFCCLIFSGGVRASAANIYEQLGVYTHENDQDYIHFDNAIIVDSIVYQYQPETDSFVAMIWDYNLGIPELEQVTIKDYVLGKPVTAIANEMFSEDTIWFVNDVVFPKTLRSSLNLSAVAIRTLVIPEGLENPGLFWECGFERVKLPETAITSGVFYECKNLKFIDFPNGIKTIEAFTGCTALTNMQLPTSVRKIEKNAFAGCKNLELYVPKSVKTIEKNAFGTSKTGKIKMLYCIKNSKAHKYAKKNKIPYTLVSEKAALGKIEKIEAARKSVTLLKGQTCYADVKVKPFHAGGQEFTYKSSNPQAVSVDENGKITGLKYGGKAVITITSTTDPKLKAKMTVQVKKHVFRLIRNHKTCKFYLDYPKEEISGYEVWRRDTKDGSYKRIGRTTNAVYTINYGKKAYYKVRAYKKDGRGIGFKSFSKEKKL